MVNSVIINAPIKYSFVGAFYKEREKLITIPLLQPSQLATPKTINFCSLYLSYTFPVPDRKLQTW